MRSRLFLVHAVCFGSGFAAIVYLATWQRMLGRFTGSDVVSGTLVASALLAGLGLGALAGGVYADRLRRGRAMTAFAACNLAVAAFALLSKPLFYDFIFEHFHAAGGRVLVFTASFFGMLVPTLIMGMSLPLLSRAAVSNITLASRTIGNLHAVGVFGAAAGAACTAWVLPGSFGIVGSVWIGAGTGAAAALGAGFAARGWDLPLPPVAAPAHAGATGVPGPGLRKWGLLIFVSGLIAIALEIAWLRLFAVLYKSVYFTFGHVLAAFLASCALGLVAAARLAPRLRRPELAFYVAQGGVCASAVLGIWALYWAAGEPGLAGMIRRWPDRGVAPAGHVLFLVGLPMLLTMVPAFLVGMSFPIVQKAVQNDPARVGRAVGVIHMMHMLGGALGGVVTGLVAFEHLGFVPTLQILPGAAAVFLLLAVRRATGEPRTRFWASVSVVFVCVALLVTLPPNEGFWSRVSGTDGSTQWIRGGALTHRAVAETASGVALVYGDERQAQVVISGRVRGGVPFWRIHRRLGLAGPVLHGDPRRVLVIGFGSGGSAYFAGIHPRTETVEVVEIVDSAYRAHRRYVEHTGLEPVRSMMRDPRYRFVHDDGRRFLARSTERYDIIEVDAIAPYTARSGMLNSREFFELVRSRLAPGGLAVHWRATQRVETTFRAVFEHGATWGNVLVGSDRPVTADADRIGAFLSDLHVADYAARGGFGEADRAALSGGRPWQRTPAGEMTQASINTDLFPRDEIPRVFELLGTDERPPRGRSETDSALPEPRAARRSAPSMH